MDDDSGNIEAIDKDGVPIVINLKQQEEGTLISVKSARPH
jgi:hypothetical protein